MRYLFVLGRQPQISAAEIEAVIYSLKPLNTGALKHREAKYLILETKENLEAEKLIKQLGGTVKIASALPFLKKESGKDVDTQLLNYLITEFPAGKIEFSLNDSKLALEIKKKLKKAGRSARYIELKNTATILHNKLVEKKSDLTVVDGQIFYTVAIQPFAEFSARDYGRPGVDDKSGMLPPKLARIMINLAVSANDAETHCNASLPNANVAILDPFCGSGTILTEAASMGYKNLIGSDVSEKAISDTKKNLDWLISTYLNLSPISYHLHVADATHLSNHIKPRSINAIVTEPYLGQPLHGNESKQFIERQIAELKKLYLVSFKEFHKILKPFGTIVFIIPRFKYKNNWLKIEIEQEIEKTGFTLYPFLFPHSSFLTYHRPNQHLAREIWRFKKTGQCRSNHKPSLPQRLCNNILKEK